MTNLGRKLDSFEQYIIKSSLSMNSAPSLILLQSFISANIA